MLRHSQHANRTELHLAALARAAAFLGFAAAYGPLLAGADRRRKTAA
jgi:hypothetical protein